MSKPQRVLACVLCQQRKVKCDRRFPCSNCTKSRVQCVPATLAPRQRRRRFPERVLLERLRKYEDLLRQHNIPFDPLHKDTTPAAASKDSPSADGNDQSDDDQPEEIVSSPSSTVRSERLLEAKNLWRTMTKWYREPEDDSDVTDDEVRAENVRSAWDHLCEGSGDQLLLGTPGSTVDLSTLHPEPVHIFRLWQTYLDNVNPLLKVTHTPSLQPRIIEAASDVRNINANLEALMFSIYAMAIRSLGDEDCQLMFATSKKDLLTRFQFGCKEALSNALFLRTDSLECLTALYIYLISVCHTTHPRSLNSIFGIVTRIARRMRIDNETANSKYGALEAEMRRRLWWSFINLDARMSELADYPTLTLSPIFDCKTPLNVNDSDLRAESKDQPIAQVKPTEAIFCVVRSALADFIRHTTFYLDFNVPALKSLTKNPDWNPMQEGSELADLERMLEDKYLKYCDEDVPLHHFTLWSTRYFIAKHRLIEQFWRLAISQRLGSEAQRDENLNTALAVLNCDTKVMSNPLTKGFRWLFLFYFPFPAYLHATQELRRRPVSEFANLAWEAMSNNFAARVSVHEEDNPHNPMHTLFSKFILDAWKVRQRAVQQAGDTAAMSAAIPGIVRYFQARLADGSEVTSDSSGQLQEESPPMDINLDDFSMDMPLGMGNPSILFGIGGAQAGGSESGAFAGMGTDVFQGAMPQVGMDMGMNQLNWAQMAWGFGRRSGW
ncbi:hypothetical protein BX600DRAFT_381388 [Xylariales sp. PMI_506]|nr:hypothetical protein BX600DRAFT_381388 [Xylariales sp. PMI_506]